MVELGPTDPKGKMSYMTSSKSATDTVQDFLKFETRPLDLSQMTQDEIEQEGGSYSELIATHSVLADQLFKTFEDWATQTDAGPLPRQAFDDAMDSIGCHYVSTDEGFVWHGHTQDLT